MLENIFMYMALLQFSLYITLEVGTRRKILNDDSIMKILKNLTIILGLANIILSSKY